MGFGKWLHDLFHGHKIQFNGQTLAAVLAVAKTNIDNLAAFEPAIKDKQPQIDAAFSGVITDLANWQTGQPTAELSQALGAVESVIGSIDAISPQSKATIDGVISIVQADLALMK